MQLIERIKHFFNVPNLVFVLLLNKEQLESAICGVYGPRTNASLYLGKFIHLYFRLPKNVSRDRAFASPHLITFMEDVLQRYGFDKSQQSMVSDFKSDLGQWIVAFNLSLRDIERACALFVLTNASHSNPVQQETGFISYIIVLKIRRPSLYEKLTQNNVEAHKEAMLFLKSLIYDREILLQNKTEPMVWPDHYFKALYELHEAQFDDEIARYTLKTSPTFDTWGINLFGRINKEKCFLNAFNRIDLPIAPY